MRASLITAFSFAVLCTSAASARAQSCVTVDEAKDILPEERHAAATFVAQALVDAGVPVVAAPCAEPFVLYHLRFGRLITVHLEGRGNARQATARGVEDLPALYQQMVKALVLNKPLSAANQTTNRDSVSSGQVHAVRALPDSLIYLRLGYGQLLGGSRDNGTAFGLGYRQEVDELGIDVSVANLITGAGNDEHSNGSYLRVQGLYFFNARENMSPYVGAGLSWAYRKYVEEDRTFSGSGPQGELSAGIEFLRATSIRLFVQVEANLPFFRARAGAPSGGFDDGSSPRDGFGRAAWVPTCALSLGAAIRP